MKSLNQWFNKMKKIDLVHHKTILARKWMKEEIKTPSSGYIDSELFLICILSVYIRCTYVIRSCFWACWNNPILILMILPTNTWKGVARKVYKVWKKIGEYNNLKPNNIEFCEHEKQYEVSGCCEVVHHDVLQFTIILRYHKEINSYLI